MPVSLSRPVRLRAKELTDTAGLGSDENPALFCTLLSAPAAVMLPYNVERIPVQRAWATPSAVHLQALGIDPENVFPLQRSQAADIYTSRESGCSFWFPMLANRLVRAIVSWKISLLAAEQVSIL